MINAFILAFAFSAVMTDATTTALVPATQPAIPATQPISNDQLFIDMLRERGDCTTFLRLLDRSGLRSALASDRPMTVFVPTDHAFANLAEPYASQIAPGGRVAIQRQLVAGHIPWHQVFFANLPGGQGIATLARNRLFIRKQGETCKVAGATAEPSDLIAGNIAVHIVDTVLLPPRWAGIKDEELLRRDADLLAKSNSGGLAHAEDCPAAASSASAPSAGGAGGNVASAVPVVANSGSDVAGDAMMPGMTRSTPSGGAPSGPPPQAGVGGTGGGGQPTTGKPTCGCGVVPPGLFPS